MATTFRGSLRFSCLSLSLKKAHGHAADIGGDARPADARANARAAARLPPALAGGGGPSTVMSHLGAEHSHGRGLLGFMTHEGATRTLYGVCRELRREVGAFHWPLVCCGGTRAECAASARSPTAASFRVVGRNAARVERHDRTMRVRACGAR